MVDMVALLPWTRPHVTATTGRPLNRIIVALVAMTGRVTMGGSARWAGKGGRSRTLQRFFSTVIPWGIPFWVCFRHHGPCPGDVSLVAGDAVLVTTAGTGTHGLERVLVRWYGQPVPGLACFPLSRVRVQARRALPRRVEPVGRRAAEQAASKAKAAAKKPPGAVCTASAWASAGQHEHTPSRRVPHAGVRAPHRQARGRAALDRWVDAVALLGAGRALREPPRPAYGTAEPPAPDCQVAVRCGTLLPLHRALGWSGPPSPGWRPGA
jgi:hypothetical protein